MPTDADIGSKKFRDFLQEWPTPGTGPYFEMSNSNVTGLVGTTVMLHCRVKNLGNRTDRYRKRYPGINNKDETVAEIGSNQRGSWITGYHIKYHIKDTKVHRILSVESTPICC
ncbi:hypothetical protein HHI36_018788, partial [Cryptolaemus montrouzieri]